jgi:putative ABC transport system permease protein
MRHQLDMLLQDVRYAVRSLRRAKMFVLTVLAIVSLGTGVASGLFGVVHHLLVQPFAVRGHERVAQFNDRAAKRGEMRGATSAARFHAYSRGSTQLEQIEAYAFDDAVLEGRDGSESLIAARATPGLFGTLGVLPLAGRDFNAADAVTGAPAVALVSERFERAHTETGGSVVGRTLRVDGTPTLVVGVVPTAAELPVGTDLWRPLTLPADTSREERSLFGVARLRERASFAAARAELKAIARDETARFPGTESDLVLELKPIALAVQDPISPVFERVSVAAVLLTLLVVAANLAGLQLARGAARRREWALRAAIGATPARLSRQSMIESLILTGAGGLVAWWVAIATVKALYASVPPTVTRFIPGWSGIGADGTLLLLVVGVTLLTGVAFGWAPALHAARAPAALALRGGGPGTLAAVHARSRAVLVIAEVALSLALLVSGVLMLDGFRRLGGSSLGFEPRGVLTFQVTLREPAYPDAAARVAYHDRLLEKLSTLPGVEAAGLMSRLPSSGSAGTLPVTPEGGERAADRALLASPRMVTPHTFAVIRLPVLRGRAVAASDVEGAPGVALVNESLARRAWPGRDPVGRRLTVGSRAVTVVGVVKDVKRNWYERDIASMVYLPDAQWGASTTQVLLRAEAGRDPALLGAPARRALAALDPLVPARRLIPLDEYLAEQTSGVRLGATVMSWLGMFALLLAAIGLHALISYHVAQRSPEFGVRMALGARREDILALVLGEGSRLVMAGFGVGLPLAVSLGAVMTATLFGVVRPDPVALLGVVLLLVIVAALALAAPAWHASRLDPVEALRRD